MKYVMPFIRQDWTPFFKQTSLGILILIGVLMTIRFVITGIFHLVF